jgi:two-component system, chemotaxis family, sensor kinase CheA
MTKDPYRYFRIEAGELLEGLAACVFDLERSPSDKETVGRLLRLAHTLKGASRVVKLSAIAEEAHAVEDVLAPFRDAKVPIPQEQLNRLLQLVDGIGARIASIDPAAQLESAPAPVRASAEASETVRVEIDEVDGLLENLTEATVMVNALGRQTSELEHAERLAEVIAEQLGPRRAGGQQSTREALAKVASLAEELSGTLERIRRDVASGFEQVSSELRQVRDVANELRLLPARSVFPSLERAARDAAQALGKKVEFSASGGEVRLDAHVLAALRDALIHVMRNAVAHGIESESARGRAGKPLAGRITISVERRGHRVAFVCQDDGRGIDVEAVRRVAAGRGMVSSVTASPNSPPDTQEVCRLLLQGGGLTTASTVTEVSGRGVGLDVVRETAERLKGEVGLRSVPGLGVTLEICVPVSLSSLSALVVDVSGIAASVPLEAVQRTLRLVDADIARSAERDSIVYEGNVIPFMPLARALRRPTVSDRGRRHWSVVVVRAGTSLAAVGVDKLMGTANVVVRPLPSQAEAEAVVAGAALDAEGHPQLILDPEALVALASTGRGAVAEPSSSPRLPLLVIDDSLTTRMLEQSILESAGYEVELATSAEEALGKAKDKRYGLFVVDVEMPGMDGFEFVARTRADAVLCETPAILVTSRGSVEDRRRGKDAGARGYIVKGEFDQGQLLQTIRELTEARP